MLNITLVDYHTDRFIGVIKMEGFPKKHDKVDFHGMNYEVVYNGDSRGIMSTFVERVENGRVIGLYDWMGDIADD